MRCVRQARLARHMLEEILLSDGGDYEMRVTIVTKIIGSFAALAFALTGAVANAAFIIDDFNVTTFAEASDTTGDFFGVTAPGSPSTEGTLMEGATGWSRRLYAEGTVAVEPVRTQDCPTCQAGRVISGAGAGTIPSSIHTFVWEGPSIDLIGYDTLLFDWSGDSASQGMTARVTFNDDKGDADSSIIALNADALLTSYSVTLPDLSGTGGAGYADITRIELRLDGRATGNGVQPGGYNGNIDNVRLAAATVPEPATAALLGLGIAGIGYQRGRKLKG